MPIQLQITLSDAAAQALITRARAADLTAEALTLALVERELGLHPEAAGADADQVLQQALASAARFAPGSAFVLVDLVRPDTWQALDEAQRQSLARDFRSAAAAQGIARGRMHARLHDVIYHRQ